MKKVDKDKKESEIEFILRRRILWWVDRIPYKQYSIHKDRFQNDIMNSYNLIDNATITLDSETDARWRLMVY